MSRYLNSFFISFVLYASVFGLIIYEVKDENFSDKKSCDVSRVCFSVINNQPTPQKEEPKQETKVEKKIVKKEIKKSVKKEPIPIEKAIPKKEIIVEKKIEDTQDETKEEETAKLEEEQVQKQNAQQMVNTKIQETKEKEMLKAKQDVFLAYLVERINSNKSYPNSARRRGVEGDVEMKFHI